jgi:hypothetical protein
VAPGACVHFRISVDVARMFAAAAVLSFDDRHDTIPVSPP